MLALQPIESGGFTVLENNEPIGWLDVEQVARLTLAALRLGIQWKAVEADGGKSLCSGVWSASNPPRLAGVICTRDVAAEAGHAIGSIQTQEGSFRMIGR